MKHLLESLRMYDGRVSLGSLAVSAVILGVLSLAPPALGRDGRVSGLPQTQTKIDLVYCNATEYCFQVANVENAGTLRTEGSTDAVEILAASDPPADVGAPASGNSTEGATTDNGDNTSTDSESSEFSGSSTPASPDISVGEEKDLISGGWN